jgi:aminopeptidase N
MKHPVRPQSYMEIRNFYTMTVYEKGAEVVRMQHTLLGEEKFQAGMKLYFERHDGQAVTCDDFVQAMQDASGVDLSPVPALVRRRGHARARLLGRAQGRQVHADREAVREPAVPHPARGEDRPA